jgi:signal transduction histidine kinase
MEPFELLQASEGEIYLLSAISSLLFALVIYSLLRNARILQAKQWATPFADTFLVLGVLYLLILANYLRFPPPHKALPTDPINIFIFLCSGITNYLFLLSALLLSAPAMNQQRILRIKEWLVGRPYVRSPLLWISCAIALAGVAGELAAIPDALVSVMVLLFMGIALYENRVRTDKAMAWLALVSAISYAALYVLTVPVVFDYFIGRFLPEDVGVNINNVKDPLTSLILLVLKFGFFFSAYSLMLSISGPLQGIERLLENVLHKEKEYLESDGIVRSILEELGLRRVGLHIKLPGSKENQIALYDYPSSNKANKQEPLIFPYRAGEIYDHVMNSGKSHREHRESSFHWLFPATFKIGVPVFFHDSVIACLEAEVGKKTFTEGNRINLERLANLISPAVQTYREMSALNKLSQDLAQLQIGVVKYRPNRDVRKIVRKVCNVTSSSTVGISVEIGFAEYGAVRAPNKNLEALVREELVTELGAEDSMSRDGAYRWLKKGLVIPPVSPTGRKIEDQLFGKFILGIGQGKIRGHHPTIGTNPTCRRALSDLVSDTLLDFIRGHLNQLTDNLGVQLSGLKVTTPAEWRVTVEKVAQEAGLLWVVANCSDDDRPLLGDDPNVELVSNLESPEGIEKWMMKDDKGLWLCSLDQPWAGTYHVIKKVLKDSKKDSQTTLWLGVARQKFGRELDYVSPWKFFLDHFCEIADSALLRIQMEIREETRNKNLAFLSSIMSDTVTDRNILHDLGNRILGLAGSLKKLENDVSEGLIQCNDAQKDLILSLEPARSWIENEIKSIVSNVKRSNRCPSSLYEAIEEICEGLKEPLLEYGIKIHKEALPGILPGAMVNVPFNVARGAIKTLLDNAVDELKEAIDSETRTSGEILIKLRPTAKKLICDITDNGRGVPPEVVPSLLKDAVESPKPNSKGVGLYLSRAWLILRNGDLVFPPQDPRSGANFRIEFPTQ